MFNAANPANSTALLAALLPLPETIISVSWSPSSLFPGWVSDGTDVTIPIASMEGLTAAAADGLTGDARAVMLALNNSMFIWYRDLVTKPTAIVPKMSLSSPRSAGNFANQLPVTFTTTAYTVYPDTTLSAEPTA